VYVLDRSTGVIQWSLQTAGPVKSSACVNPRNGHAYIGSHDHHVYALGINVMSTEHANDGDVNKKSELMLIRRATASV